MNKAQPTIKIMVVDDHDLVRHGLTSLLSAIDGIEVVTEANSGEQAIEYCRKNAADLDIIMMDINMPGMGGLEATQRLHRNWPNIGIIIVSVHAEGSLPKRLLSGGARGYLSKGNKVDEMVTAIRDVHAGGCYIAKDIAQQLALSALPGEKNLIDLLSQRELQVLMMIAQGKKNNAISATLSLSPKTVSTYRKRLHEKLEVESDIEMMHLAIKNGLLDNASLKT
ncbi:MAG: response regulator [Gammaproteobacteria bacterium]|nr:response regulator [Gammaproteobacteria bacterium]